MKTTHFLIFQRLQISRPQGESLKSCYYCFAKNMVVLYLSMYRGSPIGFFDSAMWTKNVSQSCNPDGQSHSHHKCLFLVHFLNSKGLFSGWWLSQPELIHWSLCSLLGVNLSIFTPVILFISSFQSFTRMTHASHENDFLLFNYDHGKTYF